MSLKVCEKRCDRCLFSDAPLVSRARKSEILREAVRDQSYFVCHLHTETVCRGFYDRMGNTSQLIRIAQRLGAVRFVGDETDPNPLMTYLKPSE